MPPIHITGTRPMVSLSFPLIGLKIKAVKANAGMINHSSCEPLMFANITGRSGNTMLKLQKKNKQATHNNQNCLGYSDKCFNHLILIQP